MKGAMVVVVVVVVVVRKVICYLRGMDSNPLPSKSIILKSCSVWIYQIKFKFLAS